MLAMPKRVPRKASKGKAKPKAEHQKGLEGGSSDRKAEPLPDLIIRRGPENPADRKDVPVGLVLLAGVMIWVLIFGTIFSYAAFYPCSFVTTIIGEKRTLDSLTARLGIDFTDSEQCKHFLRLTMAAPGFVSADPFRNQNG